MGGSIAHSDSAFNPVSGDECWIFHGSWFLDGKTAQQGAAQKVVQHMQEETLLILQPITTCLCHHTSTNTSKAHLCAVMATTLQIKTVAVKGYRRLCLAVHTVLNGMFDWVNSCHNWGHCFGSMEEVVNVLQELGSVGRSEDPSLITLQPEQVDVVLALDRQAAGDVSFWELLPHHEVSLAYVVRYTLLTDA